MGLPRVCCPFGSPTRLPWDRDAPMGDPWHSHRFIVPPNGSPMGFQRGSDGFTSLTHGFIVFTWDPHVASNGLLWVSHGSPRGLPWDHTASMGLCSEVSHGSTMDANGTFVPMGLP